MTVESTWTKHSGCCCCTCKQYDEKWQESYTKLVADNEMLRNQLQQFNGGSAGTELALREAVNRQYDTIKTFQAEHDSQEQTIKRLVEENMLKAKQMNEQDKKIKDFAVQYASFKLDNDQLRDKLHKAEERNEKLQKRNTNLHTRITQYNTKIAALSDFTHSALSSTDGSIT
jgi:chromosome segregation ATPase